MNSVGMVYDDYRELLDVTTTGEVVPSQSLQNEYAEMGEIDRLLSKAHEQERQRIESELAEIDDQLEKRTGLHDDLVDELERELEQYEERLQQLINHAGSQDEIAHQKARIRDLSQELRREHRKHWRDQQKLLAERRDLSRELATLENDFFSNLL